MCSGCSRVWTILHVLCSSIYVSCGAAQLVAAIFFLISVPALHLSCNLWAGSWNILFGIGGGMVACFGQISSLRQELLLYITISILTVNTVNSVLNEWGLYMAGAPSVIMDHPYHTLINYACYATRISAVVVIVASFLDSQLAFCSMQSSAVRSKKKLHSSHEHVSDIEYIIPRKKSITKSPTAFNAYSQSWVFDADNASCSNNVESPYLKVPQEGTPKSHRRTSSSGMANGVIPEAAHVIDNPVVHIEEASDDSASNSDRKLYYMKSFSRSASPAPLSASSSQISLNASSSANNAPIYECLEKLTEPAIYRTRLNSALSNREDEEPEYQAPHQAAHKRVECVSPLVEKVQYASLMKELQKAIVCKKEPSVTSPPSKSDSFASDKTHSKSSSKNDSSRSEKNSDAEFSKELEAALQLIQDLESPNTIETPSEPKLSFDGKEPRPLPVWRSSDASESEKTLSAVGSLAEIASPLECQPELSTFKPVPGKLLVRHCDSQSTSGYSSPTHKSSLTPVWSTTSSMNGSNHDIGKTFSYVIHNTPSSAVISLYPQTNPEPHKSVTLVTIAANDEPPKPLYNSTAIEESEYEIAESEPSQPKLESVKERKPSASSPSVWNVKSLLRKKKQAPRLCPELEGAIIKSESLAYLSELELLARHQRNKDIQRQIEQRVLQQLGTPWSESNC